VRSKCATENPAGERFCVGCGSLLPTVCPRCGAENTPSFKFCGDCGASLSAASSPSSNEASTTGSDLRVAQGTNEALEGERKTVNALFADIKGSTLGSAPACISPPGPLVQRPLYQEFFSRVLPTASNAMYCSIMSGTLQNSSYALAFTITVLYFGITYMN